jgi:hypothetical protein
MNAIRELTTDELESTSGGGMNLGNIAAISDTPRGMAEVVVAFGVWNMAAPAAPPQTPAGPCVSNNDDDTGYCSFL